MKEKLNSIQALRALACLCVFIYHCFSKTTGPLGVSVFFYLSGFLLVYRHLDQSDSGKCTIGQNLRFAWSKMKTLYPLYLLSMLPFLVLEVYEIVNGLTDHTFAFVISKLAAVALMIQSWIPSNHYSFAYNGVGWYVSCAVFCYFVYPWIIRKIRRYTSLRNAYRSIASAIIIMLAVGVFASPVGRFLRQYIHINTDDPFEKWIAYNFPPFRVLEFLIGCNLGYIFKRREKPYSEKEIRLLDWLTLVFYVFGASVYIFRYSIFNVESFRYAFIFIPVCIVLVYSFALGKGRFPRLCTNAFFIFIGNLSGWIFLLHMPVMKYYHIFMEYFGASTKLINILIVPVVGGITVVLSLIYDAILKREKNVAKQF